MGSTSVHISRSQHRRHTALPKPSDTSFLVKFIKKSASMEVAAALLDASRKLSTGNISNSDDSTCSSNNTEGYDKTGDLPTTSWLAGWGKRARSLSESSSTPDKTETTMAWLGGWPIQKKLSAAGLTPNRHRIRRSSSKDVEEAMAGGLGKADMYMPPM